METDLTPAETAASTESAHTTSRKSAPTLRMDLIPRGERRRRWTTEQKQTIAAQSLAPGASPTEVARLHGIRHGSTLHLAARLEGSAAKCGDRAFCPR
jgi:transposase-like protein